MDNFDETTFGILNADTYDARHDPGTTDAAIALISEIAGAGRILEFAIGTGRLALPLAAQGHDIVGIEGSPLMVEKLREKPGGDQIPVEIGDMAVTRAPGDFQHVFLAFNTLFNLQSQEAQIQCFQNAANHLVHGGTFLVEAFVPDMSDFTNGQRVSTKSVSATSACIEAATHNRATQTLDMQRIWYTAAGIKLVPLPMRYAYPPEIDLMARLAGFTLINRWGGWDKTVFDADSTMHVSVYEKTQPRAAS